MKNLILCALLSSFSLAAWAAPLTPTGLSYSVVSTSSVLLRWSATTDTLSGKGYKIYKNLDTQNSIASTTQTSYTVSGLKSGDKLQVRAYSGTSYSSASAAITIDLNVAPSLDTSAPSAPTGLYSSSITDTQFILKWTASQDNVGVVQYQILKNGLDGGTSTDTTHTVSGLVSGTTYQITVVAKDAAGNFSTSASLPVKTTGISQTPDTSPPTAPSGLDASSVWSTQLTLSWMASTDNVGVKEYVIYSDDQQIAVSSGTSKVLTGLSAGSSYNFTVQARDAAGNLSAASNQISVGTTASAPNLPSGPQHEVPYAKGFSDSACTIYVSPEGNDSSNGRSPTNPKKDLALAFAKLNKTTTDGLCKPTQLRLIRGKWNSDQTQFTPFVYRGALQLSSSHSGTSTNRVVIGSYPRIGGPGERRPILQAVSSDQKNFNPIYVNGKYILIEGLEIIPPSDYPADFSGVSSNSGIKLGDSAAYIDIQDNYIRGFKNNIAVLGVYGKYPTIINVVGNVLADAVHKETCPPTEQYADRTGPCADVTNGMYAQYTKNLTISHNVWIQNGWRPDLLPLNTFNHTIYISTNCSTVMINKNIMIDADGIRMKSSGKIEDNVMAKIATNMITTGYVEGRRNFMIGGRDLDAPYSGTAKRAWSWWTGSGGSGSFSENLVSCSMKGYGSLKRGTGDMVVGWTGVQNKDGTPNSSEDNDHDPSDLRCPKNDDGDYTMQFFTDFMQAKGQMGGWNEWTNKLRQVQRDAWPEWLGAAPMIEMGWKLF